MIGDLIKEWHSHSLGNIGEELGSPRLVMGSPLWGEEFVSDFLNYHLPSLLTNRLDDIAIVLYCDGPAEQALHNLPYPIHIRRLPDAVMEGIYREPAYRHPLLAAVHNLLINEAAHIGAGFHFTCPDAIYSDSYFNRLLDMTERHDAMVQSALVMSKDTGRAALERIRQGRTIFMASAAELGRIGWENMNPQWASWTMDGNVDFNDMPWSHFLFWRGKDTVRIHCAHANPIWISTARCAKAGTALGGTIDSELPRYVAGDFYAPKISDQLVCISMCSEGPTTPRIPFAHYQEEFWKFIGNNRDFLPFFTAPGVVPIPFDDSAPDDAELDRRLARLMARLER